MSTPVYQSVKVIFMCGFGRVAPKSTHKIILGKPLFYYGTGVLLVEGNAVGEMVSIWNLAVGTGVSAVGVWVGIGIGVDPSVGDASGVGEPWACFETAWGTAGIKPSLVAGSPSKSW